MPDPRSVPAAVDLTRALAEVEKMCACPRAALALFSVVCAFVIGGGCSTCREHVHVHARASARRARSSPAASAATAAAVVAAAASLHHRDERHN